jgi:hypothetical protein
VEGAMDVATVVVVEMSTRMELTGFHTRAHRRVNRIGPLGRPLRSPEWRAAGWAHREHPAVDDRTPHVPTIVVLCHIRRICPWVPHGMSGRIAVSRRVS